MGAANLGLTCERITTSHRGFVDQRAFDWWFPKKFRPSAMHLVPAPSEKHVRFEVANQIAKVVYTLVQNGKMSGKIPPTRGKFKTVTGIRYECNLTSTQVINKLAAIELAKSKRKTVKEVTLLEKIKNFDNKKLCVFSTRQRGEGTIWRGNAWSNYIDEAKRRGLTCGVVETTTTASSTSNTPTTTTPSVTQTATATETTTSAVTVATTPTTSTLSVSASSTKWREAKDATEAQRFANEIQASIVMFMAIAEVIEKQPLTMKDRVLSVVDSEIVRLQQEKQLLQDQLSSRFSTPIRPNNANLSVSAFRAADTFPKIPFYVPGTNEIGEMLVVPRVSDDGYLNYQFDFLDPTSTYDKVRDSIDVAHDDIGALIFGLNKVDEWTKVAQENNVNRRIEKTASCIPDGLCEEKKQGVSSTEVVFQVYEDGSTAGRIQRNKGKFMVGYNMSVESSILLSAYLIYMRDVGAKEFNIGVMTDDEVKDLFD